MINVLIIVQNDKQRLRKVTQLIEQSGYQTDLGQRIRFKEGNQVVSKVRLNRLNCGDKIMPEMNRVIITRIES